MSVGNEMYICWGWTEVCANDGQECVLGTDVKVYWGHVRICAGDIHDCF